MTTGFLALLLFGCSGVLSIALRRAGHHSRKTTPVGMPRPRPERILIIGATGGTGRHLVRRALERGFAVTALVRDPSNVGVRHPKLTVLQGDILDTTAVDAAMSGSGAVLCALGHKHYLGPTRILSEGTRNLVRAMEAHGVPRLVCETSLGVGDSAGRMGIYYTFFVIPVILPFYFWDKTRQERIIAASRLEWTIVRPGALTHGPARGRFRHGAGIGSFLWTVRISRADVADFMLDQLENDGYQGSAPGVSG